MTENQREVVIFTFIVNETKLKHSKALKLNKKQKYKYYSLTDMMWIGIRSKADGGTPLRKSPKNEGIWCLIIHGRNLGLFVSAFSQFYGCLARLRF